MALSIKPTTGLHLDVVQSNKHTLTDTLFKAKLKAKICTPVQASDTKPRECIRIFQAATIGVRNNKVLRLLFLTNRALENAKLGAQIIVVPRLFIHPDNRIISAVAATTATCHLTSAPT